MAKNSRPRAASSTPKTSVTRNDVALLAGVAPSTVSYVINNGPRSVSVEARQQVLKAIAKLGYHPSGVARSLRTRRTQIIGLVIPDITNPYYGDIAQAVEEVSFENGYTVILAHSSHLPERELRYAEMLRSKQADGAIFLPVTPDLEPLHLLQRAGIAVVVLERLVPGYSCVLADEHGAGLLATRHLLELGHRRIACIVAAGDSSSSVARVEGYRTALLEAEILPDKSLVIECAYGYGGGETAAHRSLQLTPRPTALVVHNDLMAIGAMKAFAEAGLSVPTDISVVGFDDIAAASYVHPPLTTIAFPKRQMGREAIEMLLSQLRCQERLAPRTTKLAVKLVARGSTARRS